MRKVLPAVPDMETQMNMSAKMIDKRTSTPKGNHSYGPFFLEYSLLAEYNLLQKQKLPGVYVIPSCETSLCKYTKSLNFRAKNILKLSHDFLDPLSIRICSFTTNTKSARK